MMGASENAPRFSVILPTYDGEAYVTEAIESVLQQDFSDFELVLVDDGSEDSTPEIIETFGTEPRIRSRIRDENEGIARTMNEAAELANGELLAFIDQDDLWAPDKLARHHAAHEANGADVVYSDATVIDEEGRELEHHSTPMPEQPGAELVDQLFAHSNFIYSFTSATVRKTAWEDVGGFDDRVRCCVDFDFWVRLADGHEFRHLPEPLIKRRVHSANTSLQRSPMFDDSMYVLHKAQLDQPDIGWGRHKSDFHLSRAKEAYYHEEFVLALRHAAISLCHELDPVPVFLLVSILLDSLPGSCRIGRRMYELAKRFNKRRPAHR